MRSTAIRVHIGNLAGESLSLDFALRNHSAARRWAGSLARASSTSRLHKPDQWYNFPRQERSREDWILSEINRNIDRLNSIYIDIIPYRVDPANPQESVNKIHVFFADCHRGRFGENPAAMDAWEELNRWLHAHESCLRSQETLRKAGIPEANFLVTWEDPFHQPLEPEDYGHFTIAKKFGTCYVNYCQVGRHFYEMFLAQDDKIEDDHILPLRRLSADSYFWFGSTTGPQSLAKKSAAIKDWFLGRQERFEALGFRWGDPALAIGWLPVADLCPEVASLPDQLALLSKMSRMDRLLRIEVKS